MSGYNMDELVHRMSGLGIKGSAELPTSSISILSHTHGRQRREERGIDKRQLQEAVKYGHKERANPGRDGKTRWRYTHKGIVYITDETSRHEITSWKIADAQDVAPSQGVLGARWGGGTSHVLLIVDHSGSMRKNDVPGYNNRIAAVYDCLARDLVKPQLRAGVGMGKLQVSLIEMSDDAQVVFERAALSSSLLSFLKGRMNARARSHGNYLLALDAARNILLDDVARRNQVFIIMLSDGAPSDHNAYSISYQEDDDEFYYSLRQPTAFARLHGSRVLTNQKWSTVSQLVQLECVEWVKRVGDLLGRDRVFMGTVAFGPPSENYVVLEKMAAALPRSSFQKLGLSAACLRTALSSLTDSITTLRTEVTPAYTGGGRQLTLRPDILLKGERQSYGECDRIHDGLSWELYIGSKFVHKRRYDPATKRMVDAPFTTSEPVPSWGCAYPEMKKGVAHAMHKFGEGAERVVYQCTEVVSFDGGKTGYCVGPRLVAKSTRFNEYLQTEEFHRDFCRTQGEAEELAQLFNRRLRGGPEWQLHFLPCFVYTIKDGGRYSGRRGVLEILVEEELEGKFTKWNNNTGGVARGSLCDTNRSNGINKTTLGAIEEDDEDYDSDYDSDDYDNYGSASSASADDVPQCFSHFTHYVTAGLKLVCDLQVVG
ncbi:hypothetical protein Vretimale_8980 [Volvox reticuliferus]|uniref:VWFA domain-containing protein n=1 Tax=Volvox reticuliferus TaxID=1737510 RepID=A0A8J4GCE0_9CHLO|nr:hypothetical protein Vretifemale_14440 [Volvox reticuliferus]GIM04393.1 hypothetical protein Vretimale_8980 [Volvox reticuliferus]